MNARILLLLVLTACDENLTLVDRDGYPPAEFAPLACVPNLDGKIEASELGVAFDVPIRYLVGAERAVDVAGEQGEGGLLWDMAVDYADDRLVTVQAEDAASRWYAGSFAPDAFVTPFDPGGALETVSRLDGEALWLLGIASREADPPEGRTLLAYQQPVALLRFPIAPGQELVSTGTLANATLRGLPYAGKDIYQVNVDGSGELRLPQLAFTQALRVRTRVTVEPAAGAAQSRRQVSFFFECFGEVARAQSLANEPNDDFTTAAELWRIGLH